MKPGPEDITRRRKRIRGIAAGPDPLYPLKMNVTIKLGLFEKVRRYGWGELTSAESGRVGGWMTRVFRGRPPRSLCLQPGRRRGNAQVRVENM